MAYLRKRMERIEEIRWDLAGVMPTENLDLLSENEKRYSREYNELLSAYQSQVRHICPHLRRAIFLASLLILDSLFSLLDSHAV